MRTSILFATLKSVAAFDWRGQQSHSAPRSSHFGFLKLFLAPRGLPLRLLGCHGRLWLNEMEKVSRPRNFLASLCGVDGWYCSNAQIKLKSYIQLDKFYTNCKKGWVQCEDRIIYCISTGKQFFNLDSTNNIDDLWLSVLSLTDELVKWCNAERQHQHNKTKWHVCQNSVRTLQTDSCWHFWSQSQSVTSPTIPDPNCMPVAQALLPRPCCSALLPQTPQLPLGTLGVFALEAASGDGWCFHSERWGNAVLNWLLQHVQTSNNSGWKPAALCDHITMKLCSLMFSSRKLHSDMDSLRVYLQSERNYLLTNQAHNVPGRVSKASAECGWRCSSWRFKVIPKLSSNIFSYLSRIALSVIPKQTTTPRKIKHQKWCMDKGLDWFFSPPSIAWSSIR